MKSLENATENMPYRKIEEPTDQICEKCESPMVIKSGRHGKFIACTGFPECRNTKSLVQTTGVPCPRCGKDLVERKSRQRGRAFYGCSGYPECDFLVNKKPFEDPCNDCGSLVVHEKDGIIGCVDCSWQKEIVNV